MFMCNRWREVIYGRDGIAKSWSMEEKYEVKICSAKRRWQRSMKNECFMEGKVFEEDDLIERLS